MKTPILSAVARIQTPPDLGQLIADNPQRWVELLIGLIPSNQVCTCKASSLRIGLYAHALTIEHTANVAITLPILLQ